jgi:hypothetical protein
MSIFDRKIFSRLHSLHFTSREHIPCTLCDLNLFQIITPRSQVFSDLHGETHKEWDLREKRKQGQR